MSRANHRYDAVIVGAGPNGLAAAITLAEAGRSVVVLEANETIGGGCRSLDLTLPGFVHDICSAIHPLGVASPFFRDLPLHDFGLEWIDPPVALAHPFDDGSAAVLRRSLDETAAGLGLDGPRWRDLFAPFVRDVEILSNAFLGPFPVPRHPVALTRFGVQALRSASGLARSRFEHEPARALFAGMAAHSMLALDRPITASFGLMLGVFGHAAGWPMARGGSQRIADAMADYLRSLGGTIETNCRIDRLDQVSQSDQVLFDLTSRQVLAIAGDVFPRHYSRQLEHFTYGAGAFKVDWALDGPVPWTAPECHEAGTLHNPGHSPRHVHLIAHHRRRQSCGQAGQVGGRIGLRVAVVEVKRGDTIASLSGRMALSDNKQERFMVLNGLTGASDLRPGMQVKLIVE